MPHMEVSTCSASTARRRSLELAWACVGAVYTTRFTVYNFSRLLFCLHREKLFWKNVNRKCFNLGMRVVVGAQHSTALHSLDPKRWAACDVMKKEFSPELIMEIAQLLIWIFKLFLFSTAKTFLRLCLSTWWPFFTCLNLHTHTQTAADS